MAFEMSCDVHSFTLLVSLIFFSFITWNPGFAALLGATLEKYHLGTWVDRYLPSRYLGRYL